MQVLVSEHAHDNSSLLNVIAVLVFSPAKSKFRLIRNFFLKMTEIHQVKYQ